MTTPKAGRGWQTLMEKSRDRVEELRNVMTQVGQFVGVDISEFRRIVNQVQKGEKRGASTRSIGNCAIAQGRIAPRKDGTRFAI